MLHSRPLGRAALALSFIAAGCGNGAESSDGDETGTTGGSGPGPTSGITTDTASSTAVDGSTTADVDEASTTGGSDTGEASTTGDDPVPPLDLPPSEPPLDVPRGTLFSADVAYGPDPAHVFDVFLPPSDEPTAMVVYIHGGGFTGGSKDGAYDGSNASILVELLEGGVAFATIDYRLIEDVDDEGVIKSLTDSRRCVQFIRYHFASLGIDPERIALYGGSAGAGTSLWLGAHDDMADPNSADPVERQSTRVRAVGVIETQATYDIVRWESIFESYGFTLEQAVMIGLEQRLLSFYGIDTIDQLENDPDIIEYRADVDMLAWMDADDAPVWISSTQVPETAPVDTGILFHHPYHALAVMEQAQDVGLDHLAYIPQLGIEDESGVQMIEFFSNYLQ
jgi:hypothetical protein